MEKKCVAVVWLYSVESSMCEKGDAIVRGPRASCVNTNRGRHYFLTNPTSRVKGNIFYNKIAFRNVANAVEDQ